jgi:sugar transferase (PEP-CTERM/EpsH1 system associated)
MRILFVVPNVPSPIRPRPLNFIRRLSRLHDVSVLCLATNASDRNFVSELKQYCSNVEVVEVSRIKSVWNCLLALFSSRPLRYAYFDSPALERRVREKLHNAEVDLLHVEHLKAALILRDVNWQVPAILDAVDCVSLFEERRRKLLRNPLWKAFSWTEWKKMARWESKISGRFDRLVISSPVDKQQYPGALDVQERLDVVANGVDLEYFQFQRDERRKNVLVFCAKLDYFPNADAALYFSSVIWPLLLARRPELQFEIIGSRPPRAIQDLDGKNNICVTGSVPDVRPHLGSASIALCPVRIQAGTQFKILEAMALGVPVIASRLCCPGLAVEPGKHLLTADTPEEYVSAVESLLVDDRFRQTLVKAGREYVETHHDWNYCVQRLLQAYAGALADRGMTMTSLALQAPSSAAVSNVAAQS